MAKKKAADKSPLFEESLEQLELIVRQLEDGQLGLSESLSRYEEGVRHLKGCYDALAKAEQKIELLTSVDEDGKTTTEPFDSEGDSAKPKRKSRSSRVASQPESFVNDLASDEDGPNDGVDVDTQRGLF